MIPFNNRTTWNSWYKILVVANEKTGAIDIYIKNHFFTLEIEYFFSKNWDRFRTVKIFFQLFHRAILETQGNYVIIDRVLFIMDIFVQYFEKTFVSKFYIKLDFTNIVR
jgi:hypothetical protein